MFKIILFLNYYLRKCLSVYLGLYHTVNPLSPRWRWQHWKIHYKRQKNK